MTPSKAMSLTLRQPGSVNTPIRRSPTARYLQNGGAASSSKITKPGVDWLKAAFAAPDFPILTPCGIPDQYTGRTLVHMDRLVSSITIPSNDYFIIVPPVPGVSHFVVQGGGFPDDQTQWQANRYDSFDGLYGTQQTETSDVVTAFRYMSQLIELVPTTNNMTWTGSISVFKVPLKCSVSNYISRVNLPASTSLDASGANQTIIGLEAVTSTNSDQYTAPSNLGCFTAAHQNNNDFPFTPTFEGYDTVPKRNLAGDVPEGCYGALNAFDSRGIPGFGQLDTIVIRVSGAINNTFVLKTWAALELQIQNSSPLYQYTIQSPLYDPSAIAAYMAMVRASPNAVSYYENSGFWDFIKRTVRTISGSLALLPGPYGQVAGGINQIMNGLFK